MQPLVVDKLFLCYTKLSMRKGNNKFGAKKTVYNNHLFDSKKEAARAAEINLLIKGGLVTKVEYQPRFDITVNNKKVAYYKADFKIYNSDGTITYEDVKGYKKGSAYSMFRLKKKLVEAIYGVKIIEV